MHVPEGWITDYIYCKRVIIIGCNKCHQVTIPTTAFDSFSVEVSESPGYDIRVTTTSRTGYQCSSWTTEVVVAVTAAAVSHTRRENNVNNTVMAGVIRYPTPK